MHKGFKPGCPRPPGAGRKKGQPNKVSAALRELVDAELGGDPIPVKLARIAKRLENDELPEMIELAIKAYGEAAPFCYPKLKAIEHSGTVTQQQISLEIHTKPIPDKK